MASPAIADMVYQRVNGSSFAYSNRDDVEKRLLPSAKCTSLPKIFFPEYSEGQISYVERVQTWYIESRTEKKDTMVKVVVNLMTRITNNTGYKWHDKLEGTEKVKHFSVCS